MTSPAFELIAHRGYPARYPENTLVGVAAALEWGARFLEVDIQLTSDAVPVLYHDSSLSRTSGQEGSLLELDSESAVSLSAAETDRLGTAFHGERIPTLRSICDFLAESADCHTFFEIKRHSLPIHGHATVSRVVLDEIERLRDRATVISFDRRLVEHARARGFRIGWILRGYDQDHRAALEELRPEVVFCNIKRITPDQTLWPGPWQWAVYDVIDPEQAVEWATRGASFVETMAIAEMSKALGSE